jgi:hypothetical protein
MWTSHQLPKAIQAQHHPLTHQNRSHTNSARRKGSESASKRKEDSTPHSRSSDITDAKTKCFLYLFGSIIVFNTTLFNAATGFLGVSVTSLNKCRVESVWWCGEERYVFPHCLFLFFIFYFLFFIFYFFIFLFFIFYFLFFIYFFFIFF